MNWMRVCCLPKEEFVVDRHAHIGTFYVNLSSDARLHDSKYSILPFTGSLQEITA